MGWRGANLGVDWWGLVGVESATAVGLSSCAGSSSLVSFAGMPFSPEGEKVAEGRMRGSACRSALDHRMSTVLRGMSVGLSRLTPHPAC